MAVRVLPGPLFLRRQYRRPSGLVAQLGDRRRRSAGRGSPAGSRPGTAGGAAAPRRRRPAVRCRSRTRSGRLVGKRAMSPTSARMRAALTGPMPCRSIRCDPVASTAAFSSGFDAFSCASTRTSSRTWSAAIRRRVVRPGHGAAPRRAAAGTGRPTSVRGAPPGISSVNSRCSRHTPCTFASAQLVAPVDQQPQHHQRSSSRHLPQAVAVAQRRPSRSRARRRRRSCGLGRCRTPATGRPASPARPPPSPRRRPAAAPTAVRRLRALHRPRSAAATAGALAASRGSPVPGPEPPGRRYRPVLVDDLDAHRRLVRVDPHDHAPSRLPPRVPAIPIGRRATLLRAGQSPLEPQPRHGARTGTQPDREPHRSRWRAAANRERPAEHLDTSLARPEP